jgi:MFS transporter, putative metabolite:H+ symporter
VIQSFLAPVTGWRTIGIIYALMATVCLVLAAFYHDGLIGGFPLMVVLRAATAFFCEGGFSNLAPCTVEQYGVRLGARSSGFGRRQMAWARFLGCWPWR